MQLFVCILFIIINIEKQFFLLSVPQVPEEAQRSQTRKCKECKNPMRGHGQVEDCPRNIRNKRNKTNEATV